MDYIKSLNWRYATKRMTGQKLSKEKLDRILEATRLAPSSFGLQPYKILVVENMDIRKKIQPEAMNQPQIIESSHILIYCANTDITEKTVDDYMNTISKNRGIPIDSLSDLKNTIYNVVKNRSPEQNTLWAIKQCYIALGNTLVAAALEEVDSTPMEGINPDGIDKVLGLKDKGLKTVVVCALGYRDVEKDKLASAKKVRKSSSELFEWLK